ncbi:MAG TPA: ATP-binding protein [Nevskiales bacterium]|nr:ATP-binding protein [Nevskiales bacterium]
MISLRPRSLRRLALAGFALVVLPLVAMLGVASLYVDRLAQQSEQLVARGVELARLGKELEEKISSLERNARQYQVLGDPALIELARKRCDELTVIAARIQAARVQAVDTGHLERIRTDSHAILLALAREAPQSATLAGELERFGRLHQLAAAVRGQTDTFINARLETLQVTAREARHFLLLMAVILIPMVMLLALYFTVQITRPVRQIENAIRSMGRGSFARPLEVDGPHELRVLGERLNWLHNRLTDLEQEKNLFLRRMSHELKTPLASLREGAELLMDGTAGRLTDMQLEIADILRNNSLELQFLIENLLDYERWREKSAVLEVSRFAFRPLLDAILQRHRLLIGNKRLRIDLRMEDFELEADREHIRITLDNLVSNAIKFAPAGGTVYLRAQSWHGSGERRLVNFEIADTGPGIPPEDRPRIFDAFYQGRPPSDGFLRGTGIGLSVVRECVSAHGGVIELLEGEYPGAHFRIRLPSPPAATDA